MAFIKFFDYAARGQLKASISKHGILSLRNAVRVMFELDIYQYCGMYFDAEEQKIGIEPMRLANAKGSRKIRLGITGADIRLKSFMDYFGISVNKTTIYDVVRGENGFIVIDLNTGKVKQ